MTLKEKIGIAGTLVSIIGALIGGAMWFASNLVWAGDYKEDRLRDRQQAYEMRIDILEERRNRATDPALKADLEKRLERYRKKLDEVDKSLEHLEAK